MHWVTRALLTVAMLPTLGGSGPTRAAVPGPEEALLDEGAAALKRREFDAARASFARCLVETPPEVARRCLLGLALTDELAGDAAAALNHYTLSLADPVVAAHPDWARRRIAVMDAVARLEERVVETHGRVTVVSAPSGATVAVEGAGSGSFGTAPRTFYLPAGRHALRLSLAGHEPADRSIEVVAGARVEVRVPLRPVAPPPEPGRVSPPLVSGVMPPGAEVGPGSADSVIGSRAVPADGGETGWRETAMWTAVGAGAALLVTGAVLTGVAASDVDELERLQGEPVTSATLASDQRLRARVEREEVASWLCYGLGVASVGASLVLGLTAPETPESAVSIRFGPVGGGFAADARVRF